MPASRDRARESSWVNFVAAIVLMLVVGVAISYMRSTRTVPAVPPDAFTVADDAAWARVRADVAPDIVVLRPTVLPDAFKTLGTADCPSPAVVISQPSRRAYSVRYHIGLLQTLGRVQLAQTTCQRLEFAVVSEEAKSLELVDVGPIAARGTSIRVRIGRDVLDRDGTTLHHLVYLDWSENGTLYEISTFDLDIGELTRIVHGLEPVK